MVKIKQKKQLNLPQLIEWAWNNPELSQYKMFEKIGSTMRDYVSFNNEENGVRLNGTVKPTDLFTVEVEEEITEDKKLEKAVEVFNFNDDSFGWRANGWKEKSIKDILATNQDDTRTETIHLINDDGTHTLIWRDGKLVE